MCDDHPIDPMAARLMQQAAAGCEESRLLMSRRAVLGLSAGLFAWGAMPRWAEAATGPDPRLLIVILRGGMDGLNTVIPHGDPAYASMRGGIALKSGETIALNSFFGLNPAMPRFGAMFKAKEAAVVHATCTPVRNRSHFDAQDNVETGLPTIGSNATGWLNRLLTALPAGAPVKVRGALQVKESPVILRGPAPVFGWSPPSFWPAHQTMRNAIRATYVYKDTALLKVLDRGIAADKLASGLDKDDGSISSLRRGFRGAARLLAYSKGPRVAVLSIGGFDTHSEQGLTTGMLAGQLGALDEGLEDVRLLTKDVWKDTVVVCVTEFGRTVRVNGDKGTDHGVGTVALLCGGAVAGGRVVADWPGLSARNLYEGSDLKPTTDLRSVFKGVLRDHLDVPTAILDGAVFPESATAKPLGGLIRAASAPAPMAAAASAFGPAPDRSPTALGLFRAGRTGAAAVAG